MYIPAMNRIYYAMFYAVQSLIVLSETVFSKHSQVKGYFNKAYIKTGILPKEFGRLYNIVFEYRQKFDYVDLITPNEKLISDYIGKADNFIEKITSFIQSQLE